MKIVAGLLLAVFLILVGLLIFWAQMDRRAADQVEAQLLAHPTSRATFSAAMVTDLPAPVRRFFEAMIAPGTPLFSVVTLSMRGEMSLGSKHAPNYLPMSAQQVLAGNGMIWRARLGNNPMQVSGSDAMGLSTSWTRFGLLGLVPVARAGGDINHRRSAFGRVVAELALWLPTALLPQFGVTWTAHSDTRIEARIVLDGLEQNLVITLDDLGRPESIRIARWSNANPERTWQLQPFGGPILAFGKKDGITYARKIAAGNFFGTTDYFAFFKAELDDISFQ